MSYPLREDAQGQGCTLRLPGCRHAPEYTILAHLRRFGWAGMGQKPHDILGIFVCDVCHAAQEARGDDVNDTDLLRALGETLMARIKSGSIIFTQDEEAL